MNKKAFILIAVLAALFLAVIIKMIITGPFEWIPLAGVVVCGGYGVKRTLDNSIFGDILLGLCILLMICILFNIQI